MNTESDNAAKMNSKNSGNAQSQKATEGVQSVDLCGSVALGGITANADTSNAAMKVQDKELPSLGSHSLAMDETIAALVRFSEVMLKMEQEPADVAPTQAELENMEEQVMPAEMLDYTKKHEEKVESGAQTQQAKLLPHQVAHHAEDQDKMMPLLEVRKDCEKLITEGNYINYNIEDFCASAELNVEETDEIFGQMHETLNKLKKSVSSLEEMKQALDYIVSQSQK